MRFILFTLLFASFSFAYSQKPVTEYYDSNWNKCSKDKAVYFRKIKYNKEGEPVGLVKDYYISGKIQWMGYFVKEKIYDRPIITGWNTFYYENGQRLKRVYNVPYYGEQGFQKVWYPNGKLMYEGLYKFDHSMQEYGRHRYWNEKGKLVRAWYFNPYDHSKIIEEYDSTGKAKLFFEGDTSFVEGKNIKTIPSDDRMFECGVKPITFEFNVKDHKISGEFCIKDSTGKIFLKGYYHNNLPTGAWEEYSCWHQCYNYYNYERGLKIGSHIYIDDDGCHPVFFYRKESYIKNKETASVEWYFNGFKPVFEKASCPDKKKIPSCKAHKELKYTKDLKLFSKQTNRKHIQWYENGELEYKIIYKKGYSLNYKWNPNGQKMSEIVLKDGSEEIKNSWDSLGHYIIKNEIGTIVEKYKNGKIKSEKSYKEGVQDGVSKSWFDNGTLSYEGNFVNGKREGLHSHWYENGKIQSKENFVNGSLEGLMNEWNEDGKLLKEIHYTHNRMEGTSKWWSAGKGYDEYNYHNDLQHGRGISIDFNGDTIVNVLFENNKIVSGFKRTFNGDRKINYETRYKDGEEVLVEWRSANGNLESQTLRRENKALIRKWNASGELIFESFPDTITAILPFLENNHPLKNGTGKISYKGEDGSIATITHAFENGYRKSFLESNGDVKYIEKNYDQGKLIKVSEWYADGKIKSVSENGKKNIYAENGSLLRELSEDGKVLNAWDQKSGKQIVVNGNGYAIYYDDKGMKLLEGNVVNGKENGLWIFYHEGKVHIEVIEIDGGRHYEFWR